MPSAWYLTSMEGRMVNLDQAVEITAPNAGVEGILKMSSGVPDVKIDEQDYKNLIARLNLQVDGASASSLRR